MYVPFDNLPSTARIWIYQASRLLSDREAAQVNKAVEVFATEWSAHNKSLQASGILKHRLFLILGVNESQNKASGCSVDSSVRFVKELETLSGISFLDKMNVAIRQGADVNVYGADELIDLYKQGHVSDSTLTFDNTLNVKEQLQSKWEIPFSESWLMQRV